MRMADATPEHLNEMRQIFFTSRSVMVFLINRLRTLWAACCVLKPQPSHKAPNQPTKTDSIPRRGAPSLWASLETSHPTTSGRAPAPRASAGSSGRFGNGTSSVSGRQTDLGGTLAQLGLTLSEAGVSIEDSIDAVAAVMAAAAAERGSGPAAAGTSSERPFPSPSAAAAAAAAGATAASSASGRVGAGAGLAAVEPRGGGKNGETSGWWPPVFGPNGVYMEVLDLSLGMREREISPAWDTVARSLAASSARGKIRVILHWLQAMLAFSEGCSARMQWMSAKVCYCPIGETVSIRISQSDHPFWLDMLRGNRIQ